MACSMIPLAHEALEGAAVNEKWGSLVIESIELLWSFYRGFFLQLILFTFYQC